METDSAHERAAVGSSKAIEESADGGTPTLALLPSHSVYPGSPPERERVGWEEHIPTSANGS